ncbi:hypothetical protein B5X24_HaOG201811 [Helicoverpa armigera]|nr:hypothetical protein B5X24_HaOG201811 [Helicoverpa armigera]
MFRNIRSAVVISNRPFKNFGHKRQPIPVVTTFWHGFLTFTFIGLAIEWKRIKNFLFGDNNEDVLIKKTDS